MKPVEQDPCSNSYHLGPIAIFGIALTSLIYFADIFLRASQKCFWFDELFTVYLSRLHTLGSIYTANAHGVDFNPPLFYFFTRASEHFFGEGLIATRLPEMLAVWLFCLCLFLFVSRRLGPLSGLVAGVLPFFTLIQYYAYEARPHGLVLGWCGLMLIFWQRAQEGQRRKLWLIGLGLCMMGALLTHVYAVYLAFPFAVVELNELFSNRRMDWIASAAILLPLVAAVPVYLPLFHVYRLIAPKVFLPAAHDAIEHYFIQVMGPAGMVVLLAIALIVFGREPDAAPADGLSRQEAVLAAAFAILPFVGWLGALVSHGPFVSRYFLSGVAGYAVLLAAAISLPGVRLWATKVLACTMFLLLLMDLAMAAHELIKHNFVLVEPSSGIVLTTTPKTPMVRYASLATADPSLDVLVPPPLQYLYFFNYAPRAVASRLYYAGSATDFFTYALNELREWAHLDLKVVEIRPFLASHHRFLLYESNNDFRSMPVEFFLNAGYKMKSMHTDRGGTLYELER